MLNCEIDLIQWLNICDQKVKIFLKQPLNLNPKWVRFVLRHVARQDRNVTSNGQNPGAIWLRLIRRDLQNPLRAGWRERQFRKLKFKSAVIRWIFFSNEKGKKCLCLGKAPKTKKNAFAEETLNLNIEQGGFQIYLFFLIQLEKELSNSRQTQCLSHH